MKWHVSEACIYDENGEQIVDTSEWYMRSDLQLICNEHNAYEDLQQENELLGELHQTAEETSERLICEVERLQAQVSKFQEKLDTIKEITRDAMQDFVDYADAMTGGDNSMIHTSSSYWKFKKALASIEESEE